MQTKKIQKIIQHGVLLVDKPAGWTSHDVVGKVRSLLHQKEVGHCGTLDPMASGLMVILLGEATKLSSFLLEQNKTYRVQVQLGLRTDTLDTTGQVLSQSPVDVTELALQQALSQVTGHFEWPVPMFSATKIQGKKLYEYAREGQEVEVPVKPMSFFDLKDFEVLPGGFALTLSCSKGAFIRTWVQQLGELLGCGAAMSGLRRIASEPYNLDQAITIDELQRVLSTQEISFSSLLIPLERLLPELKVLRIQGKDEVLMKNGQISHDLRAQLIRIYQPHQDLGAKILSLQSGKMISLVELEKGVGFRVRRVFQY